MYKNEAYIIRTKTNLHAGSGDTNFGIVDKQVQRDSISNLPIINSSSLKGAIRDHFSDLLAQTNDIAVDSEFVKPFVFKTIFGDEQKNLDEEDSKTYSKLPKQGLVKFIDAKLLFLPLRSNKKPYYHVTSVETLKNAKEFLENFGINLNFEEINTNGKSVVISKEKEFVTVEDVECETLDLDLQKLKDLFNIENLAIFTEEDFNEAVSNLPVIARNKLNNGKSENLWYEEVLPRESILYTLFCYYDNLDSKADSSGKSDKKKFEMAYKLFEKRLLEDNIQIGANASIGYGITKFSKLEKLGKTNEQ